MNERANQLAHYLQEVGVQPEVLVGIYVERNFEMIVGLLGILKAGGAYIPLDPVYSQERIGYILQDTNISILLTQQKLLSRLSETPAKVICLDTDWKQISDRSISNPISEVSPDNLAYGIYTSGSTGKPKGVAIAHKSLMNFVSMAVKEYGINEQDRILQFASISFDTAVEEIYPCLITGGTLVLRTDAMLSSSDGFWQQCRDWQLSVLDLPTSYWHHLTVNLSQNSQNLIIPESLRLVIIGGEQADREILRGWLHAVADLPNPPELINSYGPTEATVVTTIWRAVPSKTLALDLPSVPIGKPIDNVQVYVLDSHLQSVPIGVPGELYIGGVGVARGYLNRPELNREKFIPNPFKNQLNNQQIEVDRLYKTGDLVRYFADGNLEFIGRVDNQVKIRGFRIELGEIEATLNQCPLVQESIVIAKENTVNDKFNNKTIVAYLVVNPQSADNENALSVEQRNSQLISEVREFIQQKLPNYMMPQGFVILDALPLTPNGKVDRSALPHPDLVVRISSEEMPQTKAERIIADIWREALEVEKVALDDNFFDLGGNSLKLFQVREQIQNTLNKELSMIDMFQYSTVRALGQYFKGLNNEHIGTDKLTPQRDKNRRNQLRNQQKNIRRQYRSKK